MFESTSATSPATPCCYKAVNDPAPGAWLSINATHKEPFCIEPDTFNANTQDDPSNAAGPRQGWFPASDSPGGDSGDTPSSRKSSNSPLPEKVPDSSNPNSGSKQLLHLQRCDIFHSPSAGLNVTSLLADEWTAWSNLESNDSILSSAAARANYKAVFDDVEEDHRLFSRIGRIFGFDVSPAAAASQGSSSLTLACAAVALLAHYWLLSTGLALSTSAVWPRRRQTRRNSDGAKGAKVLVKSHPKVEEIFWSRLRKRTKKGLKKCTLSRWKKRKHRTLSTANIT